MAAAVLATVNKWNQKVKLYWNTNNVKRNLRIGERGVGLMYNMAINMEKSTTKYIQTL